MRADAFDLRVILGRDRRLMAPLFQRPYVWKQEEQWEPLWEDIRRMADGLLSGAPKVRPHFLGAIVLDQLRTGTGQVESRWIIDGQQRLITLQVVMSAFRDACGAMQCDPRLGEALTSLMVSQDPFIENQDERFKVWPTNIDRSAYRAVMTGDVKAGLEKLAASGDMDWDANRIIEGYLYFFRAITEWLGGQGEQRDPRAKALLNAIREKLKLVVIDMDDEDDAQMIFETLNARGTPLLASDLVKNFLFHRAAQAELDSEKLYTSYWRTFDTDQDFWRKTVGRGRSERPRIDVFLQHYLALVTREEIPTANLFRAFQDFALLEKEKGADWHLRSLAEHAGLFQKFHAMPAESREGAFFDRLDVMETTTAFPFLLGLYRALEPGTGADEERRSVLLDIESFLVRRMTCRLSTRSYNRLFLDLLEEIKKKGGFSSAAVRGFLVPQTAESTRWPNDKEFREAWLAQPLYSELTRGRLRMVLGAIDERLASSKTEGYKLKGSLTIEHMLPQDWEKHWALVVRTGEGEGREEAERRRNLLKHTMGNLTLVTKRLNPSLSNGPYPEKRKAILTHSALNLNRWFQDVDAWDETEIARRGEALLKVACGLWPHPAMA